MTVTELRNALKAGTLPWLILAGEEEYLKRHYLERIREALVPDAGLAAFNHIRFEGEELDFGKLTDAVTSPPVFSDTKLVEWHLCDFEKMKQADLERLKELCERRKAYEGVTLLFYAEAERLTRGTNPKKPARRFTELEKIIDIAIFPRSTDSQLLDWIGRHLRHEGITPSDTVGRALIERSGHAMDVLAHELEKLAAYAHAKGMTTLSEQDVLYIAAPTFEADAFGLGNALLERNAAAALENLRDMKNRRIDPAIIFGSVFRLFSELYTVALLREAGLAPDAIAKRAGLHEYKVKISLRAIGSRTAASLGATLDRCRALDLSGKSGTADYSGLERLIAEESTKR